MEQESNLFQPPLHPLECPLYFLCGTFQVTHLGALGLPIPCCEPKLKAVQVK
jgi:hypothetical protein